MGDFMIRRISLCVLAAGVAFAATAARVQATPYASNVVVSGTSVTYTLNEDTDTLKFSVNGGAFNPAPDGLAKGPHAFTIPLGATFSIQAEKNSAVGYTIPTGNTNPGPPGQTNAF